MVAGGNSSLKSCSRPGTLPKYSAMGLTRLQEMMILKILENTLKALSIIGVQKSSLLPNLDACVMGTKDLF